MQHRQLRLRVTIFSDLVNISRRPPLQTWTDWRQCVLWSGLCGAEGPFPFGLSRDLLPIKVKRSILFNKQPPGDHGGYCAPTLRVPCSHSSAVINSAHSRVHLSCTRSPRCTQKESSTAVRLCVCTSMRLFEYWCGGGLKSKQLLNRLWLIQPRRS